MVNELPKRALLDNRGPLQSGSRRAVDDRLRAIDLRSELPWIRRPSAVRPCDALGRAAAPGCQQQDRDRHDEDVRLP